MYKDCKIGVISELKYKEYRNTLNRNIKLAKQSYYINIFTNFKSNTKKIWNTVNQIYKNKRNSDIKSVKQDNISVTDMNQIADIFNKFYCNIAPKLDNEMPPSSINATQFLNGNYPTSMAVPIVCPQDVIKVINSLKNKKSNIKELPVSIIKDNKDTLAIPISILFNQSISEGIFPQTLKHATVIPIHKKGNKDDVNNYRPISLLSVYSKIF